MPFEQILGGLMLLVLLGGLALWAIYRSIAK